MKILIDIGHPAHVHFFAQPMRIWQRDGCRLVVTSRHKEIATDLLDAIGVEHQVLSAMGSGNVGGLAKELVSRDRALYKVVRREKPDIMAAIGGVFIAHVGFLSRTPSIVFYDTENAVLSNLITYPFCSQVVVPSCYHGWLPPWHLKYPGYHELSYLHPDRFTPSREVALSCGLDPVRPTFLIRTVSWQASHDLREEGWSLDLLRRVVTFLSSHGKVLISAEGRLPEDMRNYCYQGPLEDIHHLMGHLALFVGESATMASECAVLGVPAIYAAHTGRGYTDEQEEKYGLVANLRQLGLPQLEKTMRDMLDVPKKHWQKRRRQLLEDTVDVASFVAGMVTGYPDSKNKYEREFRKKG